VAAYPWFVRVLGVDVGERRIGLAVSDVSRTLARPLHTIESSGSTVERVEALLQEVADLQREDDGLDGIVVGLPRALDGSPPGQTDRVLTFVAALRARATLAVELQDERLSSREAESRLAARERDWRKRKSKLDAAAAAVILQDYLDAARIS
jgi:putative Holliday junction resolvase